MKHEKKARKGKLPPFVPLFVDTLKTPAWRALSHGARSLYTALKGKYSPKLQNSVYLSTRDASRELGAYSHRDNIRRWFRELEHYGFIRMISPGCLGVDGHGRAPHYRLTDSAHKATPPTRDYLKWDGTKFEEKRSRMSTPKFRTPDHPSGPGWTTHPVHIETAEMAPKTDEVDHPSGPYSGPMTGPPVRSISRYTTSKGVAGGRRTCERLRRLRCGLLGSTAYHPVPAGSFVVNGRWPANEERAAA